MTEILRTIKLPNKRLIDPSELAIFLAENGDEIKRSGLTVSLILPGSSYTHVSKDPDDGRIRATEAVVPKGKIYVNLT